MEITTNNSRSVKPPGFSGGDGHSPECLDLPLSFSFLRMFLLLILAAPLSRSLEHASEGKPMLVPSNLDLHCILTVAKEQ
jgi:hypothetical protein